MNLLYHYTNLDSLELILKHKTIRFSSLAQVNDSYEGETQDIGNLGRYIFVSCWTSNAVENLRLWEMYGNNHHGVRIGLEFPIFDLFYDENNYPSLVPHIPEEILDYTLMPTENNKLVNKIQYTDDPQDVRPKTLYEFWNQGIFDFGKLGKWKSKNWIKEEESRFIIYSLPIKWDNNPSINGRHLIGTAIQSMKNNKKIPITFIDLNIQKSTFQKMQIIKGAQMTNEEETKLKQIVNQYNTNTIITNSSVLNDLIDT
jgi:hypothetical protein